MNPNRCIYCGIHLTENSENICALCRWKKQKAHDVSVQWRPRKTWVGYKPRKEATKKERIEKANKKYKNKGDE